MLLTRRTLILSGAALVASCDKGGTDLNKHPPQRSPTFRLTSRDGTQIAYERRGTGPPVVLVDGAFCSRRFGPSEKLAAQLAGEFTVYTYDRRGRGESGDNRNQAADREVEDLAAIIKVAGGSPCVFGMSSGGVLALEAAARGVQMDKLAVYEAPYLDAAAVRPPPDLTAQLRSYLRKGDRGGAVKYYMSKVMQMPRLMVLIMPLTPHWGPLKASAPSLLHEAALMGDFNAPLARLARISVRTLALAGGGSEEMMRQAATTIASAVQKGRASVLVGQSHDVSPDVLAPLLLRYFAS